MNDLERTLSMPHLGDMEELKEKAEVVADNKKESNKSDPKLKKVYTFELNHTDKLGKSWKGTFENHILSIRETQTVGIMQARLSGGMLYESIDPVTRELNYILSHLSVSLSSEVRPEWAKDLQSLEDAGVLYALYGEVAKHTNTFLGL